MNMKKIVLALIIILCCGCNAKYELIFENDKISENLDVTYPRSDETMEELNEIYTNYLYAVDRNAFYEFNNNSTKESVDLEFSYNYKNNNLKSSNLIKSCVDHFDFFEEDNKYYLTAKGTLRCNYYEYIKLETLDISIKTNHNVLENNADEIKKDKYIWHIDLNNLENIDIRFITDNKENKQIKKKEYKKIFIIACAISLVALLLLIIISIRHKRVNKI